MNVTNNKVDQEFYKNTFKKMLAECVVENNLDKFELNKGDTVDQSSEEREYNLNAKLKGRDFIYLKKVKQALLRIEEGSFGKCNECDCTIEKRRLLARPTASKCIGCKEEEETLDNKHIHKNSYSAKRRGGATLVAVM